MMRCYKQTMKNLEKNTLFHYQYILLINATGKIVSENNPKRQFTPNICCKIKNMDPNLANKAGLPAMDRQMQIRILEDDHNHSFKNHHFTSQSEVVELGKHNLITFTGMYH